MKKIFFLFLAISLSSSLFAQSDITPKVAESIKSGNATLLASYFMAQIELTIEDTEGTFSKAEAEKKLIAFFGSHGVTGFEIKHQGTSKLDDQYRIGDLTTKNGTFRVTFFIRKNGNSLQIKQLKIEAS
jgi:hypothetical protein